MPTVEVRTKVRIVNPIDNGDGAMYTSLKRAAAYVQEKRAVVVAMSDANKRIRQIRFIDSDPRNEDARRRAAGDYNAINRELTVAEVSRIPIARPGKAIRDSHLLITRRSTRRHGRTGKGRVIFSAAS